MPALKTVIWVGSSRRDLRAFPQPVKDHMGYALSIVQRRRQASRYEDLSGFGGAGVVEVVKDFRGDTFRAVYTPCGMRERTSITLSERNRRLDARRRAGTWNW